MATNDHRQQFKCKGTAAQERRRSELLDLQDKNRSNLLDRHRKLVGKFWITNERGEKENRNKQYANALMLSEWMQSPPDDLFQNWAFLPCPEGTRCVVFTKMGETVAIRKNGCPMFHWQSGLPGGSGATSNHRRPSIMLDCIFVPQLHTFYVLDVLEWSDLPLVDTDFLFRQFWLKSKFSEMPEIKNVSTLNTYPILHVEATCCSPDALAFFFDRYPYFEKNCPKVDGVLFYHKEGHYMSGTTPLVLWAKVFMLPELTSTSICCHYYKERPRDYTDYHAFIRRFDKKYTEKKAKGRRRHGGMYASAKDSMERSGATVEDRAMETSEGVDSDEETAEERMRRLVEVELE